MIVFDDNRVSRYWDNDKLLIENTDNQLSWKILEIKKIILEKFNSGEWSKKDYTCFEKFVKKIVIKRFYSFYNLLILYLKLPKEVLTVEIENLNQFDFVNPLVKSDSSVELMVNSIYEFHSQMLKLAKIEIIPVEDNLNLDEKIEAYNAIYTQLKDPESSYSKLLSEVYNELIDKCVIDEQLNNEVKKLNYIVFDTKINQLNYTLTVTRRKKEIIRTRDANAHAADVYTDALKKQLKRR